MARDGISTRFPFISLEKALARAQDLHASNRSGKPMLVPTAFEVWGYSPKSSGGFQTIAALMGYGLLQDEGANNERKVRLTDAARRYFLDERDDVRASMLAEFALAPPMFNVLWHSDRWSEGIPADTVARSHLKIARKLNDQSARSVLSIFKENVLFAGLRYGIPQEEERPVGATEVPQLDPHPSTPTAQVAEVEPNPTLTPAVTPTHAASVLPPGHIDVRFTGKRVVINADVDLSGIQKLKLLLVKYEEILRLLDDDRVSIS